MESRYRLVVAGQVSGALAEEVRRRFGNVTIRPVPTRTVIDDLVADQAALRALLALLWDVGSDVLELEVASSDGQRSA